MSLINNAGPKLIGVKPKLNEDQVAVIDLLKEALAQALRGDITSVGIIACMKTGYATVMAGPHAAALNFGCDSLKKKILAAVEEGRGKRLG